MADGRIRTVQPNLINLKETVVNILHISSIYSEENLSRLWKSLKMVLRFPEPSTNAKK